ncbi:C-22 sterol desaturase [Pseudohyphozyma bogoriensis]|nr:C-22 sterol desaturase [Pseudohyphozyma bogoriensis]
MAAHASPSLAPPSFATSLPSFADLPVYFGGLTNGQIASSVLVLIVSLLILEQSVWRARRGKLAGHSWQIPIIGQFAESLHPSMEAYKRSWANPLSAVSVFNIFIVIASKTEDARKILNSSTQAEPCLVRSAKQVLLPENWVFLNGKVHNEYRKGLNCLFTREALGIYLTVQDRIYRKFFNDWMHDPEPNHVPYQMKFRDLNMQTSLRVFCGNYISQEHAQEVSDKYWQITKALELVNFPFAFPGTKVWGACRARAVTVKYLSDAAAASKKAMAAGKQPDCLLDAWVEEILAAKAYREGKDQGAERPNLILREYSDHEMALVLLSFIFASQDAMSSCITFAFQHLADYPEILAKVRAETEAVRGDDVNSPMSLEVLDQMPYVHAVSKEVLRHRPPVIMVPYLTTKNLPLNENYTVPKGTMLIPSFWNSLHDPEVYPEPEEFIPERWMPGGANESPEKDAKNWLVFGAGAHRCIAQSYVMMHMSAVISAASMMMDWTHEKTPESDEIQIIATLFPKDGCRMKFTPRNATKA